MEDDLQLKTTFGERRLSVEDDLLPTPLCGTNGIHSTNGRVILTQCFLTVGLYNTMLQGYIEKSSYFHKTFGLSHYPNKQAEHQCRYKILRLSGLNCIIYLSCEATNMDESIWEYFFRLFF